MGEAVPRDEANLLERARRGDVQAFGELVRQNQGYLYNAIYHLVGADRDAEDIAQDVFVRAYSCLDGFEGRARFSTWLYGIMLNTVRDHWRRRRRHPEARLAGPDEDEDERAQDPVAPGDGPPEGALRQERVAAVRRALAQLGDDMREVVVLRDIQGLSYDELAEALDVPLGTVKSRLHRARLALRDMLQSFYGVGR